MLSRAIVSFSRRHGLEKASSSFERAWRCTSTAADVDMPCAPYHQEAAGKAAAFSGMGISPSNLPRSLLQNHRTCPHHFAKRLAFFKSMGVSADGFCKIVSMYPQALTLDPDTELKVSIALLESALGKSLVGECILSWPSLLGLGSLHKELLEDGAGIGLGSSQVRSGPALNKEIGLKFSFPQQASVSSIQESALPQQEFASKFDFLLKCGFRKNTKLLAKALHCALHKSKQDVDAVVHALMSLGLSRNHASRLIKLQPTILQQKPSEITSKLDYILNTLCLSFEDLFKYSSFMLYSVDSHIRPRYLMHGWLKSKRLLRRNFKLDYIMSMPEKQFLCKFVECHEDGMNMYHGFMGNAK